MGARLAWWGLTAGLAALVGCDDATRALLASDADPVGSIPQDAATRDAATRDGATRDAATRDAATRDAATRDQATPSDLGASDSALGPTDAGRGDAGAPADADAQPLDGTPPRPDACDARAWYVDGDADGFGDSARPIEACDRPPGTVARAGDCDDADATRFPGAEPACGGVDQDCDDRVDHDLDGDGVADGPCRRLPFDPATQRHIELMEVIAGEAFAIPVYIGWPADPRAISLPGDDPIARALEWDVGSGQLTGQLYAAGVYRFPVEICTRRPYDPEACADPAARRAGSRAPDGDATRRPTGSPI